MSNRLLAGSPDHRLQRDPALFALGVDLLPLGEVLQEAVASFALGTVREDDEGVVGENLGMVFL